MSSSFARKQALIDWLYPVLPIIQRIRYGRHNPIQPWSEPGDFLTEFSAIRNHTLLDRVRCHMLWQWLGHARGLPGDVAELGVFKGGTAHLLAVRLKGADKRLHLFDTFGGMPEVDRSRDWHRPGDFADTSLESVQNLLNTTGFGMIHWHPGLFPETATGLMDSRFCFVHVDADIYPSVKSACEFFFPRLVPHGVMIFDDYGQVTCPGAKDAVDDYFADSSTAPIYLPTGQALVIGPDRKLNNI